jgi:Zn-dependent peptidase ImmA (M78 family)
VRLHHNGQSGGSAQVQNGSGEVFVDRSPVFFRDETSSSGVKWQEMDANAFAAELLMPSEDLKQQLNEWPIDAFDDMSIRRLAARFGVSAQALTIRLTRLGLVPDWVSN